MLARFFSDTAMANFMDEAREADYDVQPAEPWTRDVHIEGGDLTIRALVHLNGGDVVE